MTSRARLLTAGQLDAGFASLATFVAGLFAVKVLDPTTLGVYALAFTAFVFASDLSHHLVYLPTEVAVLERKPRDRLAVLRHSFPRALPVSLLGASGTLIVTAVLSVSDGTRGVILGVATSAAAASLISPLQDHVRRLAHLSGASWLAATMSVVQFVILSLSIGVIGVWMDLPHLAPFGSLLIANVLSASIGISLGRRLGGKAGSPITFRRLFSIGGWLLFSGLTAGAAGLFASTLIKTGVGVVALGAYEAARVVARPMQVVSLGIAVVLGPRSMEAANLRSRSAAISIRRLSVGLALIAGSGYALFVGPPWPTNVLDNLLPNAYLLSAMVGLMVVFNTVQSVTYPYRAELLGAQRQGPLARAEVVVNVVFVVATALAIPTLGAYAIPVAGILSSAMRWYWYKLLADRIYAQQVS